MVFECLEQLRLGDSLAYPPPDTGGVIEAHQRGRAAYLTEDAAQAMAYVFSGFPAVCAYETHVRKREVHHQHVQGLPVSCNQCIGLAEVNLHGARRPLKLPETRRWRFAGQPGISSRIAAPVNTCPRSLPPR